MNYALRYNDITTNAVEYCIQLDILREFLETHRREVKNMCLTEFNEERYGQIMREEGWEDGFEEGKIHGIIDTCDELGLSADDTASLISKKLGVSLEDAQQIYDRYKNKSKKIERGNLIALSHS